MIEKAIYCEDMLRKHRSVIISKLSGDLMLSPPTVDTILNKGLKDGQINFNNFYESAKGYIYIHHTFERTSRGLYGEKFNIDRGL